MNYTGAHQNAEVGLMTKRSFNDFNIKLNGKVDSDEIALETSYKSHPSYEIMMKIETPFECARSVQFQDGIKIVNHVLFLQFSS
jgi:hypothetical protein